MNFNVFPVMYLSHINLIMYPAFKNNIYGILAKLVKGGEIIMLVLYRGGGVMGNSTVADMGEGGFK